MELPRPADGLAPGDLSSFLAGYLRCRAQTASRLETIGGGTLVRYARPMRRTRELYIQASQIEQARGFAPAADDWVTVIGSLREPAEAPPLSGLAPIERESFMSAPVPLATRERAGDVEVTRLETGDDIAAFNALGAFPKIELAPASLLEAAFFVARVGGEIGATGRYALGKDGDAIVDRMVTLDRFRRRGLANAILGAMDQHARRHGARRMLLISSEMGRPLYAGVGFKVLAPVTVFAAAAA